ncbi:hypothetical protein OH77DRAFT_1579795 [Trametes cingulata]|nr:hypothetical protein OH77DRAFT_1579795 [Trametes cingulata]
MSARAPFVPQRPASRATESKPDAAQSKSPPAEYEPFRPTGLLEPSAPPPPEHRSAEAPAQGSHQENSNGSENTGTRGFAAKFKPLNLSGLRKLQKADSQPPGSGNGRPSLDSSLSSSRSPRPFPSAQHPRPSNPYLQTPGSLSMNAFKAPAAPAQTSGLSEEFSSNRAHIVSPADASYCGSGSDAHSKLPSGPASEHFRFSHALDASFSSHRSRTASQPSLSSIHEVAEEEEAEGQPHSISFAPPAAGIYGDHASGFGENFAFPDSIQDNDRFHQGLRRMSKRVERADDDGDEYAHGVGTKRYKATTDETDLAAPYKGRSTPAPYPATPFGHTGTLVHSDNPLATLPQSQGELSGALSNEREGRQALYRLLGQDLDIFVEAHADSYEEARKKWTECSMEKWTQGADELAGRFGNMLDFVKDHMTSKLALYASLHTSIAQHKEVLAEREQTLCKARESLVREGGAVVGTASALGDAGDEAQ